MTGETSDRSLDEISDIGVLSCLQDMKSGGTLGEQDKSSIMKGVTSEWGQKVANQIINDEPINDQDKTVLRQYSNAF